LRESRSSAADATAAKPSRKRRPGTEDRIEGVLTGGDGRLCLKPKNFAAGPQNATDWADDPDAKRLLREAANNWWLLADHAERFGW
jgi:hypothetical protein